MTRKRKRPGTAGRPPERGLTAEHNEKAPTPEGEGLSLPELDSNQQPAG
jgi:hypothetical protein